MPEKTSVGNRHMPDPFFTPHQLGICLFALASRARWLVELDGNLSACFLPVLMEVPIELGFWAYAYTSSGIFQAYGEKAAKTGRFQAERSQISGICLKGDKKVTKSTKIMPIGGICPEIAYKPGICLEYAHFSSLWKSFEQNFGTCKKNEACNIGHIAGICPIPIVHPL